MANSGTAVTGNKLRLSCAFWKTKVDYYAAFPHRIEKASCCLYLSVDNSCWTPASESLKSIASCSRHNETGCHKNQGMTFVASECKITAAEISLIKNPISKALKKQQDRQPSSAPLPCPTVDLLNDLPTQLKISSAPAAGVRRVQSLPTRIEKICFVWQR